MSAYEAKHHQKSSQTLMMLAPVPNIMFEKKFDHRLLIYNQVSWILKPVLYNLSKVTVILSKSRKVHNNTTNV